MKLRTHLTLFSIIFSNNQNKFKGLTSTLAKHVKYYLILLWTPYLDKYFQRFIILKHGVYMQIQMYMYEILHSNKCRFNTNTKASTQIGK